MRMLFVILSFLMLCNSAMAQNQEQYSRMKIYLDNDQHTFKVLSATGIAVDHGEYKKNTFFISDFSESEIKKIKNAGFKTEIMIADVSKYYREQNKKKVEKNTSTTCVTPPPTIPNHFHLGTYAGFFSYDEMLAILDSMQMLYPGLISIRYPIDTFHSIEGRQIFWLRISNNPSVSQPLKPQVLYTSLHHAREPGSLSSTIYSLWYLLENYTSDPQIKAIIDNEELYFVPCVNPDGYIYNVTNNPFGGGMWRKNRRMNFDGTYGVDLNRNYGYEWGYDNIGSSPNTVDDTYRGTAGFSEPETQAIKWFTENHHFTMNLNYHTYHNDLLFPWNYIGSYQTVDSNTYFNIGMFLTKENNYRYGTCNEMLDYISNGASDDWMYGDTTTKNKVYGMTPEIGTTANGFYPPTSQIIPDCQNNLRANINVAALLLPLAIIDATDKKILIQSSGFLHFNLQRLGFPNNDTFKVSITPLDSWISVPTTVKTYTGLSLDQQVSDSFSYSLLATTPNGQLVGYVLHLYNGLYTINDTVQFYYGKYYTETNPSCATMTDWISTGWNNCTTTYFVPPASIKSAGTCTDFYPANIDMTIATANPTDLTHAIQAYLHFYTKWAIETDYDYVAVNASVSGTGVWTPLCAKYTRAQISSGIPMYDGNQPKWVEEEVNLGDYLGQNINIQFELNSDAAVTYDGFYFNDVNITTVQDSTTFVAKLHNVSTKLLVTPNPASNIVFLTINDYDFSKPLYGKLYNCLGEEVIRFILSDAITPIDISQLPESIYYLKITGSSTQFPVQKIEKTFH